MTPDQLERIVRSYRSDRDWVNKGSPELTRLRELAEERDRLAAALERIVGLTSHWGEPWTRADCLRVAREALAQANQEQTG